MVHLAAISRVAWAVAEPQACWDVNVGGTRNVVDALRPDQWVLFASSREVYGDPAELPATEDAPLQPMNVYGRAKVAGEDAVHSHLGAHAVVRLSNVYGRVRDHHDRVVPAFASAAAAGGAVRVDGHDRTFDFVHLDDVVQGLIAVIRHLDGGAPLPALHLTTGVGTSLGALAELARSQGASRVEAGPERSYDVSRFVGDPARASWLLGWRPQVGLVDGFADLVAGFREAAPS